MGDVAASTAKVTRRSAVLGRERIPPGFLASTSRRASPLCVPAPDLALVIVMSVLAVGSSEAYGDSPVSFAFATTVSLCAASIIPETLFTSVAGAGMADKPSFGIAGSWLCCVGGVGKGGKSWSARTGAGRGSSLDTSASACSVSMGNPARRKFSLVESSAGGAADKPLRRASCAARVRSALARRSSSSMPSASGARATGTASRPGLSPVGRPSCACLGLLPRSAITDPRASSSWLMTLFSRVLLRSSACAASTRSALAGRMAASCMSGGSSGTTRLSSPAGAERPLTGLESRGSAGGSGSASTDSVCSSSASGTLSTSASSFASPCAC
mmetsp:Transcript_1165/g.3833  ORF Transcript_1165/g.3833 Transcript_1165/m.3833 type:complete len:329 (+) Transcript_1165:3167-4153(+)